MSSMVNIKSRPPNTVVRRSKPVHTNVRRTINSNNDPQSSDNNQTDIDYSQDPVPLNQTPYEDKETPVITAAIEPLPIPQNQRTLPQYPPPPRYPPVQPQVQPIYAEPPINQVQVPALRPLYSMNKGSLKKQDSNQNLQNERGSKIHIKKTISYVGNEDLREDQRELLLKAAIEKRKNLPAPKKRIGWIREDPDYVPCFFGNSCRDWIIIILFLIVLYAFVIALGILILWLSSFETDLVLGIYGIIGLVFMFGLSLFIYEGQKFYEVRRLSEAYVEEFGDKIK